ncbi:hypothetical protein HK102_003125, partial [Quaeritorhiza haematococci]
MKRILRDAKILLKRISVEPLLQRLVRNAAHEAHLEQLYEEIADIRETLKEFYASGPVDDTDVPHQTEKVEEKPPQPQAQDDQEDEDRDEDREDRENDHAAFDSHISQLLQQGGDAIIHALGVPEKLYDQAAEALHKIFICISTPGETDTARNSLGGIVARTPIATRFVEVAYRNICAYLGYEPPYDDLIVTEWEVDFDEVIGTGGGLGEVKHAVWMGHTSLAAKVLPISLDTEKSKKNFLKEVKEWAS